MKILKKPTEKDAGIGIENNKVYHFLSGNWIVCGDCKTTDKHIKELL